MASLQTKLCLLYGHLKVFMTSIKAQHKLQDERLKAGLQRLIYTLFMVLDEQSAQSKDFAEAHELDEEDSYNKFCEMWNRLFLDIDCWNVEIIDGNDPIWLTFYVDFKALLKYAHYLSHKKPSLTVE